MTEANGRNRSAIALAVAAQIRAERAASGLTQRQVMDLSGLPKSTYLRLESGERVADVSQLAAFCAAVGVPLAEFMHRAEERLSAPAPTLTEHVVGQMSPEGQAAIADVLGQAKRTRKGQPNG